MDPSPRTMSRSACAPDPDDPRWLDEPRALRDALAETEARAVRALEADAQRFGMTIVGSVSIEWSDSHVVARAPVCWSPRAKAPW